MRKMHNPLLTKVFSCFLAYLIAITPFAGANLAFAPGQTHRFAPTITFAAKPSTLIPPNPHPHPPPFATQKGEGNKTDLLQFIKNLPLPGGVRGDFTPLLPHYPPLVKGGKGGFSDEASKKNLLSAYMKMPLFFIKNQGQMDERVKFYEKGNGHTTFFTKDGIYLALSQGAGVRGQGSEARGKKQEIANCQLSIDNWQSSIIKLIPLGANKDSEIIAEGLEQGRVNYFLGNDSEKWKTHIPTYKAVVYREIYPGIDMKFYGNSCQRLCALTIFLGNGENWEDLVSNKMMQIILF